MSCFFYVVGNKCDLNEADREVSVAEGEQWVEQYKEDLEEDEEIDLKFMEVSAKNVIGII